MPTLGHTPPRNINSSSSDEVNSSIGLVTNFQHEVLRQFQELGNKIELCTSSMEIFKNEIKTAIVNVQSDVFELKEEVKQVEQEVEQIKTITETNSHEIIKLYSLLNENRIDLLGIPHNVGENLYDIFQILCAAIGVSSQPKIEKIYRLKASPNKSSGVVVVKL